MNKKNKQYKVIANILFLLSIIALFLVHPLK
ncbi:hypothetical protein HLPCO_000918 [Haloplasma contractile SSD-17B]|uniref:Uncharacterized protein n=1 Tax=Haloplasma contractile SSD-17B TaxID=1033810 RepID=F7PWD8_9MOLU|nr:hypothetical protein HLPCO_000918 [Haloplasma contractile SSD-17B]